METGIYCIENMINNKKYIGKSVNINKRWNAHKRELNNNIHKNDHLRKAWCKYGKENFKLWIIENCEENILLEKEIYWIKKYETNNSKFGYNMTKGGDGSSGRVTSEETKIKLRESHKGLGKGRHLSEETKNKLREINKGENNPNFGKHPSEETKTRISNSNKGKTRLEETKEKMSKNHWDTSGENNPFFGKHHSEETKKNMSKNHPNRTGENNPKAILKESDVLDILDLFFIKKFTKKEISDKYSKKCSSKNINHILKGETWKHIYNMFMEKGG